MSKTQHKNAKKMWDAFVKLVTPAGDVWYERKWRGVGEIAKAAGMSKPTVRKYLKMAVEQGVCIELEVNGRFEYRMIEGGE